MTFKPSFFISWSDDEPPCDASQMHAWELGEERQVPTGPLVSNWRCSKCGCWRRTHTDPDGTASDRYGVE